MDAFDLNKLIVQQKQSGSRYLEFLRVPSMSLGVYTLPAGGEDTQQPHTEDEIYYVAHGRATIRVGDEDSPVIPGSVVYVAANVEHRFHNIIEELTVLVFFAPSEYTYKGD
jgi:mannose-6-phosphate isomerase-like protein (cupin superfamily)